MVIAMTEHEQDKTRKIEEVIIALLTDYPILTKTMLSSHVNPYAIEYNIKWHPILERMIKDGRVERVERQREGRRVKDLRLARPAPSRENAP
jgi:hypothetical protein